MTIISVNITLLVFVMVRLDFVVGRSSVSDIICMNVRLKRLIVLFIRHYWYIIAVLHDTNFSSFFSVKYIYWKELKLV
jgi:hypothetical protein